MAQVCQLLSGKTIATDSCGFSVFYKHNVSKAVFSSLTNTQFSRSVGSRSDNRSLARFHSSQTTAARTRRLPSMCRIVIHEIPVPTGVRPNRRRFYNFHRLCCPRRDQTHVHAAVIFERRGVPPLVLNYSDHFIRERLVHQRRGRRRPLRCQFFNFKNASARIVPTTFKVCI